MGQRYGTGEPRAAVSVDGAGVLPVEMGTLCVTSC